MVSDSADFVALDNPANNYLLDFVLKQNRFDCSECRFSNNKHMFKMTLMLGLRLCDNRQKLLLE